MSWLCLVYMYYYFSSCFSKMINRNSIYYFVIRSHLQAAQLTVRAIQYQRKLERLDGGQSAEPSGTNAEGGEAAKTAEEMNTNSQDGTDFVKGDKEDADCSGESGAAKNPYEDKAARSKLAEDVLPLVLEAMWAANVIDIQGTLRKVLYEKFILFVHVSSNVLNVLVWK